MSRRATRPGAAPGHIQRLGPFDIEGVGRRRARLYVSGADRAFRKDPPLLVLFDGQNVFDDAPSFVGGWHAHEAVERRARTRRRAVTPVVLGIDHGGVERRRELNPFAPGSGLEPLLDWIAAEGIPAARRRSGFPLLECVIGGSSLGGLAAFYAHLTRPGLFRAALVMSPAIPLAEPRFSAWFERQPTPPASRIYLDTGTRRGDERIAPAAARLAAALRRRGWRADELLWRRVVSGAHHERYWRRRLPRALNFLFG